jgi:membrane protease YdiL (CAAX protease family)
MTSRVVALPRPAAAPALRAAVLAAAVMSTATLRAVVMALDPRIAIAAGGMFGLILLAMAFAVGWRPSRPRLADLALGLAGGVVLLAVPMILQGGHLAIGTRPEPMVVWAALTVLVATGEEIVLRGVVMDAIDEASNPVTAIIVTSVLFGLMHVPVYGWAVVPVDIAAGIWLAGLRRVSGGVAAPAVAHVIADLATRWL